MRSLLPLSLLAVAASAGAQTYAPLLPAVTGTNPQGNTYSSLVAPNFFGGNITATITASMFGVPSEFNVNNGFAFTYINGTAVFPGQALTTLTFSESITQLTLGWAAPAGTTGFNYFIFDGATEVSTGFVNTMAQDPGTGNAAAFLDFTRLAGFTSVTISVDGAPYAIGYGTAAVPEPSTYGLILGGLALAGAAVRRRKNSK